MCVATDGELERFARALFDSLQRSASIRINETELREDTEIVLREAVRSLYGLEDIHVTAERNAAAAGGRRPYDKLYGGVVVEWEWAMGAARRTHGAGQALDYLNGIRSRLGRDSAVTAVVCDGRQWGFLAVDPVTDTLDFFCEAELSADARFEWRENSVQACRRFLELVGSYRQTPITAGGIAAAFGPNDADVRMVVALLTEALQSKVEADRTDTLYREWRRLLDVVYGDLDAVDSALAEDVRDLYALSHSSSVGESLFALHTYFALIARLIAVELLAIALGEQESRPTRWPSLSAAEFSERLEQLDAGQIPSSLHVDNLFEGDLFSWFLDGIRPNVDLTDGIRRLCVKMDGFAFPRVAFGVNPADDILRDLYQVIVPRRLRSALGEFLTPHWLADSCLERLTTQGANLATGRILDPTCGTGTFLVPILRRRAMSLRQQRGQGVTVADVQRLLHGVVGFDINPVAVIASRVNYVVALGDLATVGPISLPVFQADSVLVPEMEARQGSMTHPRLAGREYRVVSTSLPDPFPIPEQLVSPEGITVLRQVLEDSISLSDREQGLQHLRGTVAREMTAGYPEPYTDRDIEDASSVAEELYERLRTLEEEGRDGVWARLIQNAFAPLFEGQFDVVVGNPPWITWMKLPEAWRRKTEPVWRRYGLWNIPTENGRRSRSLASTDLATLVFAVALDRYLAPQGLLGLLTPASLILADPGGRAFRQFCLREAGQTSGEPLDFRIRHVDDWGPISPFSPEASNRPVFIVAARDEGHEFPVSAVKWNRVERGARLIGDWRAVRTSLSPIEGEYNPVDRSAPSSAWSFQPLHGPVLLEGGRNEWSFGVGLHTRGANGVYVVEVEETPDRRREFVVVRNRPREGRNPAVAPARGMVEAPLVWPFLRGRDVQAWTASPSGSYIIAPYVTRPGESGLEFLDPDGWREYPLARRWFRRHFEVLSQRHAPPTRSWRMDGDDWCRLEGPMDYMMGEHIVVVRELQARPAAALVERAFDETLWRGTTPLIDHKLMFCSVDSHQEAAYLVAFINSTPMQDLLASFASSVAVSPQTLARLPIPSYDGQGKQLDLMRLAEQVLTAPEPPVEAARLQERMDSLVLGLLEVDETEYQPQPPAPRPRASVPPAPANTDPLF